MKLNKLDLNEYGKISFELDEHSNIMRGSLTLKPDLGVSIITNSPVKNTKTSGAYGDWDEQTFEMAVLVKNRFATVEKLNEVDEAYMMHGGIWPHLNKEELLEKIKLVKENC